MKAQLISLGLFDGHADGFCWFFDIAEQQVRLWLGLKT
jgi:hypothetical protein